MNLITYHEHWAVHRNGVAPYSFDEGQVAARGEREGIEVLFMRDKTIITRDKKPPKLAVEYHFGGKALRQVYFADASFSPEKVMFIGELERMGTSPRLDFKISNLIFQVEGTQNWAAGQAGNGESIEMLRRSLSKPLAAIKHTLRLAPEEIRKAFRDCPDLPS